ncbi:TrmH family RNA methyltransferase [Foetidibacter luteolus]|uniref:TrmH family RNA methyltransferase n=1 Tax=Foetidibacter luteolus TaxID=2608880 RepID=UPI00129B914D|nr:RNA methyltransferase [Foetidibacter luteolus]
MTPQRESRINQVLAARQNNITLVMENIEDPRNIAAVMRTCDSVGIQHLYIVNYGQPHRKKWKYKSAKSAAKWLTLHQLTSVEDCVAELRQRHYNIYTTRLAAGAVSIYQTDFTQPSAIVFGNEQHGVSDAMASLADGNILVPQAGMVQSLNISVACAVTVYEAYRQKQLAGHYNHASLPAGTMEKLRHEWGLDDEL